MVFDKQFIWAHVKMTVKKRWAEYAVHVALQKELTELGGDKSFSIFAIKHLPRLVKGRKGCHNRTGYKVR